MDEEGGDLVVDKVDADGRADPEIEQTEPGTRDVSVASFSMPISIIISLEMRESPSTGCMVQLTRVVALEDCCSRGGEG